MSKSISSSNNVHPTAIIEPGASVDPSSKVWHFAHVRTNSIIEKNVSLGRDVFVDEGVRITPGCRIQNGVSIFRGVLLSPFVFVGPHVVFTNDVYPRASVKEWNVVETFIKTGASIGAGAIIRCGITIGEFAMIGAGAIVTKSVPPLTLALGSPAIIVRQICLCGRSERKDYSETECIQSCCHQYLSDELIQAGLHFVQKMTQTADHTT